MELGRADRKTWCIQGYGVLACPTRWTRQEYKQMQRPGATT